MVYSAVLLSVSLVFWHLYVWYIDINKMVNTEYWLECLNFSLCHYQLIISLLGVRQHLQSFITTSTPTCSPVDDSWLKHLYCWSWPGSGYLSTSRLPHPAGVLKRRDGREDHLLKQGHQPCMQLSRPKKMVKKPTCMPKRRCRITPGTSTEPASGCNVAWKATLQLKGPL